MNTPKDPTTGQSTLENVLTIRQTTAGRIGRRVVLGVLSVFLVLALAQYFGSETSRTVSASGYQVTVEYSPAGRAGMPSALVVSVQADKPIAEPVVIAVSETYLDALSVDNVSPEAESENYTTGFLELNYNPPHEKEFEVHLRGSWESGNATGASGSVRVSIGTRVVATVPVDAWLVL